MVGRITAMVLAFMLVGSLAAYADEVGGQDIPVPAPAPPPAPVVIQEEVAIVEQVSAPPPPFVEIERTSIAAGVGLSWGDGTLLFEGERYPFEVKGISLGDFGAAKIDAEGAVRNLDDPSKFAGTYVAVEAGVAAGVGASTLAMRNEHGVVITLTSSLEGGKLTLGAEGLRIVLK